MSSLSSVFFRDRRVAVCAGLTLFLGLVAIAGWLAEIPVLRTAVPGYPEMKPVTAGAFVCSGVALLLLLAARPRRSFAAAFVGSGVAGLGIATLCEYAGLIPPAFPGGNMSLHSAVSFLLIGTSFVLLSLRLCRRACDVLVTVARVIVVIAALGILYGAEPLYGVTANHSMAIPTVLAFILLTTGIGLIDRGSSLSRLLASRGAGGRMGRRIIPIVLLVPPFIGLLLHAGSTAGLYDPSFRLSLTIGFSMAVMATILYYYSVSTDEIDARRRSIEDDLAAKEEQYRDLFNYSQGLICMHTVDGKLLSVNPAVLSASGYAKHEIEGHHLKTFVPPDKTAGVELYLREIEHQGLSTGLLPIVARDGRDLLWRFQSILVSEADKTPYVIGHALDVTELMAAQHELKALSLTDELTGLYNRRGFLTLAEQQLRLERHSGTARGLTLLFADMDGLKKINDTLGHEAGSEAIKDLAQVVRSAVRGGDLVARWGGDEFVILTIGAGSNTESVIDRIYSGLEHHNMRSGRPYTVACSIGKADVEMSDDRSFDAIIAEADHAMYEEKKRRKAARIDAPPTFFAEDPNQYLLR